MLFNEYTDILETGEVIFLDEENLYQIMLEEDPAPVNPSNGLNNNDSTATAREKATPNVNGQTQQSSEAERQKSKGLFNWFKVQSANFKKFGEEQKAKLSQRISELSDKLRRAPADYNGEEEVEIPSKAMDKAPRPPKPGDDPEKFNAEYERFKKEIDDYNTKSKKKFSFKQKVKGAGCILGGRWLIKRLLASSAELDFNLKEGSFHASYGMGKANQAAAGNGFAGSIAVIVKNVFLAILVLIGGIFKIIKEYLGALGRIVGTIFGTIGQAGKTLVTGQMPSK